ncbi:hypothetical protein FN846DRAFT_600845 [Sphaerosporella brunnea]|uniref:Vacuolar membrane protein n=1 Tax=Sphaerosporella brunnea TaxID=1250544 RepID=A0A5J5F1Q8_9PEZI|nr:hypothetical protein FN846DRAFT_600845 [Sphaerosporella brunnea]
MGFFGGSREPELVLAEHKFAYVNMDDFNSKSCLNYMAYIWIYIGTIISIVCYAADIYTAIILLAFNRWTNDTLEQSAIIDFNVARIIFCVCIFGSFVLLAVDWFFAVKVIKSDGVAEAYMNPIVVRYNCIRGGRMRNDTGWKRFLVFAKLTEERGVVDYLALFTYFAFKGWVRIIVAEGPRVVINALTFISVTKADVIVQHGSNQWDGWDKFGKNVEALYNENKMQAMILGSMAFTSLVWVFAILRLLAASVIYIFYLWHTMSGGQTLRKYCKERIDKRMGEIVQKKHDKALKREKKQNHRLLERQPTIPVLAPVRKPTFTSEDSYDLTSGLLSNAQSPANFPLREPKLPNISVATGGFSRASTMRSDASSEIRPPPPARSATNATTRSNQSNTSYASSGSSRGYPPPPYADPREQPQYAEATDSYGLQEKGGARRVDGYSGDDEGYQMQQLPPNHGGRPQFVADRLARSNTGNRWDNGPQPPMPQGRFPPGQQPGWGRPTPGPRSQTAGPQMQGGYGPPPRSQTAGPGQGGYGPPLRSQTVGPQMRGGYGPPPPSQYSAPDPYERSQSTWPLDGAYRIAPRGNSVDDGYEAPTRSATTGPGTGGYGPLPPRSQTVAPMDGRYGTPSPPRSQTVAPMDGRYGLPPPRSQTAAPGDVGYFPPRTMMITPIEGGYGTPPRGNPAYGQQQPEFRSLTPSAPAYAKAAYQPAARAQGSPQRSQSPPAQPSQTTQPSETTTTTTPVESPQRSQPTPPVPVREALEEFGPPRRRRTEPVAESEEAGVEMPALRRSRTTLPPPHKRDGDLEGTT